MRTSVASLSKKVVSAFFAATLALGSLPIVALADESAAFTGADGAQLVAEEPNAAIDGLDHAAASDDGTTSKPEERAEDRFSDGEAEAAGEGEVESDAIVPVGDIVNQEMPLDTVVAQAESTRSFFLAQTLESTRTVPIVSAKLPLDMGGSDSASVNASAEEGTDGVADAGTSEGEGEEGEGSGESAPAVEAASGVSVASTVVGSFEYLGMTFAIEPDGSSVALVAIDYGKLSKEYVSKQVIAIPETASPDGIDSYSVTRIADDAFAGLTKDNANPDHAGARELLSDEGLLAEAGIDPADVAELLADDDVVAAAQVDQDADASSSMQAQAEASAYEDEAIKDSTDAFSLAGAEPGPRDGDAEAGDDARASDNEDLAIISDTVTLSNDKPDSTDEIRAIVSMDGNTATLDDGSTYEFKNPLAGCTGILAAYIPASVTQIEDDAFTGSDTLQYLVVSDDNPEYASFDGALYSADLANLRLIPEGRVGAVRVASSATSIDPEVFSHCPLVDALVADAEGIAYDSIAPYWTKRLFCMQIEKITQLDIDLLGQSMLSLLRVSGLVLGDPVDVSATRSLYGVTYPLTVCLHSTGYYAKKNAAYGYETPASIKSGATNTYAANLPYGFSSVTEVKSHMGVLFVHESDGTWTGFAAQNGTSTDKWFYGNSTTGLVNVLGSTSVTLSASVPTRVAIQETGTVKVNPNGGTYNGSTAVTSFGNMTSYTLPNTVVRTGYKFIGWSWGYADTSGTTASRNAFGYFDPGAVFTIIHSNTLFTANWGLAITWNATGGSVSPSSTTVTINGTATAPSATLSGWTFAGWYTNTACTTGLVSAGGTTPAISANTTYYAKWTRAITFNLQGGSGTSSATATRTASDTTGTFTTPAAPTRSNWTFKGWTTSATGTSYTAASTSVTSTTATWYARWQMSVTLDANGGTLASGVTSPIAVLNSGTSPYYNLAFTVGIPTRANYTFAGWRLGSATGTPVDSNGTISANVLTSGNTTLVAAWTLNTCTVKWATAAVSVTVADSTVTIGSSVTTPTPALSGYTLEGWYTDADCTTGRVAPGAATPAISKDTTYYAKWTSPITFRHQRESDVTVVDSVRSVGTQNRGMVTTPAAPVRDGWTFKGWVASAAGTDYIAAGATIVATSATYYARWQMNVTLDANGGALPSGISSPIAVLNSEFSPYCNSEFSAGIPTRTGFTFDGWRTGSASGTRVDMDGTVPANNMSTDQTLYAAWKINTYHLSWEVPHGTHANRTSDFTVEDCPIAMTAAVPDAGYTFQGWSGTGIASGSKSFVLSSSMLEGKGDGETFSYVASFSANPYTAHLHANDGTDAIVEHGVTYDASVPAASVPKRYGYVFSGYWTKETDGTKGEMYFDEDGAYVKSDVWRDATDVDLYACWTLMANLEVPINAPGAVTLGVDRATAIGEDAAGTQAGPSVTGTLRSAVPQEVPLASVELEPLKDDDGTSSASRILGEGNPERCAVEVSLGSSASALLRLADPSGTSLRWEPASPLVIPAAVPVAADATGDDVTTDALGNLARTGELSLSCAMKLLPGFDVYEMPTEDVTSEPIARIVFTVDLTGLAREEF